MQDDLKYKLRQLLAEATDCETIGNLVSDPAKRMVAMKMADEFRSMAARLRQQIEARNN